jgi:hypothetical protein
MLGTGLGDLAWQREAAGLLVAEHKALPMAWHASAFPMSVHVSVVADLTVILCRSIGSEGGNFCGTMSMHATRYK